MSQLSTILRTDDGAAIALEVARWRDEPTADEYALLDSIDDPVLDVGCGPGRLVAALAAVGRPALGIDPSGAAIAEATNRGAPVLCRSVFAPLPAEGRWRTALLLDGNVGIGGDPPALLRRIRQLVAPAGEAIVEVDPPGTASGPLTARLESGATVSPWFPWARVGADDLADLAAATGWTNVELESRDDRWFGRLRRPRTSTR